MRSVLSEPRTSTRWYWLDIAAITIGVLGLAVVGAYVIVIRLIEWVS